MHIKEQFTLFRHFYIHLLIIKWKKHIEKRLNGINKPKELLKYVSSNKNI